MKRLRDIYASLAVSVRQAVAARGMRSTASAYTSSVRVDHARDRELAQRARLRLAAEARAQLVVAEQAVRAPPPARARRRAAR